MTDVADARRLIQIEESRFKFAVSESMIQKIAGSTNFILNRNHQEKQFFANGRYNGYGAPQTFVDGFTFFQFDAYLIDVWAYVQTNGAGGTTELDIKYAMTPGGAFSSIFSTTPQITAAAGNNVWVHVGSSVPNTTAPVLAITDVDAAWALRFDILQVPSGAPYSTGVVIHYRPR